MLAETARQCQRASANVRDTKGGQGDLVPSEANLLPVDDSFAELEEACRQFLRPGQRAGAPGDRRDPWVVADR